ncbi:MAG: DUF4349 domain-containing protein [Acidobacteriota bacterium]
MAAADDIHSPTPEEIMEYLDGEGTAALRSGIEAHLALCGACQVFAAGHRRLATDVGTWHVEGAPASLRAPDRGRTRVFGSRFPAWLPVRRTAAGIAVAAVVVAVFAFFAPVRRDLKRSAVTWSPQATQERSYITAPAEPDGAASFRQLTHGTAQSLSFKDDSIRFRDESSAPARPGQTTQNPARMPAIVRTATLRIVTNEFSGVRPAVERIVAASGGFVDKMTVMSGPGAARALHGTLRIPSDRLGQAADGFRALGQVTQDTQGAEDVTDQLIDLDVRLRSARATELRMTELLRIRTAKLSEVLEVERELARVRVDIERLDAESVNIGRRVGYATLTLDVEEERKAGLSPGPLSLGSQVRIAAADGLASAFESLTSAVLSLLRALPFLVLWSAILSAAWLIVRRAWAWRTRAS